MFEEPFEATVKFRQATQNVRVQSFHSKQPNQSYHGALFQWLFVSVRRAKLIVVEGILFAPETEPAVAGVDGRGDVEKMFEEFGRDVLVNPVVQRQFERDAHQV